MKFLEDTALLASLNNFLSRVDVGECIVKGRAEAYTCKLSKVETKLSRSVEHEFNTTYDVYSYQRAAAVVAREPKRFRSYHPFIPPLPSIDENNKQNKNNKRNRFAAGMSPTGGPGAQNYFHDHEQLQQQQLQQQQTEETQQQQQQQQPLLQIPQQPSLTSTLPVAVPEDQQQQPQPSTSYQSQGYLPTTNTGLRLTSGASADAETSLPFGDVSDATSRKTLVYLIATLNQLYPDYDFSHLRAHHFSREANLDTFKADVDNTMLEVAREWAQSARMHGANETMHLGDIGNFSKAGSFSQYLWSALEEMIGSISECEVYTYRSEEDPENELDGDELAEMAEEEYDEYSYSAYADLSPNGQGSPGSMSPAKPVLPPMSSSNIMNVDDSTMTRMGSGVQPSTGRSSVWSFKYFLYNKQRKRVLFFTCKAVSKHALAAVRSGTPRKNFATSSDEEQDEYTFDDMEL